MLDLLADGFRIVRTLVAELGARHRIASRVLRLPAAADNPGDVRAVAKPIFDRGGVLLHGFAVRFRRIPRAAVRREVAVHDRRRAFEGVNRPDRRQRILEVRVVPIDA